MSATEWLLLHWAYRCERARAAAGLLSDQDVTEAAAHPVGQRHLQAAWAFMGEAREHCRSEYETGQFACLDTDIDEPNGPYL